MTHTTNSVHSASAATQVYLDDLHRVLMINGKPVKMHFNIETETKPVSLMTEARAAKIAHETRVFKIRERLCDKLADAMEMGFGCRMERDSEGEAKALNMYNNTQLRMRRVELITGEI
jgi:hypothetical protein